MNTAFTEDHKTQVQFSSFPVEMLIQHTCFPVLEEDSSCGSHVIAKETQLRQRENSHVSFSSYSSLLDFDISSL